MTNNKQNFTNPFQSHPEWDSGQVVRLVSRVPQSEYNFFYCINPEKGTVQTVVNQLLFKLNNELRKRNITSVTEQSAFIDFVLRCELCLPEEHSVNGGTGEGVIQRDASPRASRKANGPNVGKRTAKRVVENKGNAGRA